MVFQVTQAVNDPRALTQAVLQIATMLDMFQAELARVLHVNYGYRAAVLRAASA